MRWINFKIDNNLVVASGTTLIIMISAISVILIGFFIADGDKQANKIIEDAALVNYNKVTKENNEWLAKDNNLFKILSVQHQYHNNGGHAVVEGTITKNRCAIYYLHQLPIVDDIWQLKQDNNCHLTLDKR